MLLQRHLLLSLLLGLLLSHYATAQRKPKTPKPGTGSGGDSGGGSKPGGGSNLGGGSKSSVSSKPSGSSKYFKCARFNGVPGMCKSNDNVCVLDYRKKGELPCHKAINKADVCKDPVTNVTTLPKRLTCIPNVGCCCKGDPEDVCNGKDDIESFCADFKTTQGTEFPDKNICGEPGPSPKCATGLSHSQSVECGAGDGSVRCKIDALGRPAGCVPLTEGTCDQKVTSDGLHCISGKGCCCIPTKEKSCNSRPELMTFCLQSNFTDRKICSPDFFTRSALKKCEDSKHQATSCYPSEKFCKTDKKGGPLGCAKENECTAKSIKGPKVQCSGNDCCCEARSDQPCNTWDEFCIANPAAPICTSKARKCVDSVGNVVHCPFNSPVCSIDKNGNPNGCRARRNSINVAFGTTELRCLPGRGCSCNAQFDGPCNSKKQLQAHCKSGGVQDPVLCPGQQRQAKEAARKGDTSGSVSGRGTPAVGLVIMALFIPRLALI